MSLILDALKKAEIERKGEDGVPTVSTEYSDVPSVTSRRPWLPIFIAVLLAFIALVLVIYLIVPDSGNENTPEAQITAEEQARGSSRTTANTSKAEPNRAQQPAQLSQVSQTPEHIPERTRERTSENVQKDITSDANASSTLSASEVAKQSQSLQQQKQKALIAAQYKAKNKAENKNKDKNAQLSGQNSPIANTADRTDIQKLYEEEQKQDTAEPNSNQKTTDRQPEPKEIQKPEVKNVAQPKESTDKHSLNAHADVKLIKDLPFSAQEKIPTMIYSEHSFEDNGQSRIVINGKNLREGNNVGSGVRVKSILKDGALFQYDRYEFKMWALNSWLNY